MDDEIKEEKEYQPPDLRVFISDAPLYESITLRLVAPNALDSKQILPLTMPTIGELVYPLVKVDAFCPGCAKHTVYVGPAADSQGRANIGMQFRATGYYTIRMMCSRVEQHELVVPIRVSSYGYPEGVRPHHRAVVATKIGMWPSLADLQEPLSPRLAKVIGKKAVAEFKRGVGLASHGIGIGAFVYLRRIFEDLVEEVAREAISANELTEPEYYKSRMDEKIGLLGARLPKFMVDNRKWYSIVSTGVHELTEEECLRYFPVVRKGVEIILDQKAEVMERAEREKEAAAAIRIIAEKIDNPPSA